jgi:hypothetical protein
MWPEVFREGPLFRARFKGFAKDGGDHVTAPMTAEGVIDELIRIGMDPRDAMEAVLEITATPVLGPQWPNYNPAHPVQVAFHRDGFFHKVSISYTHSEDGPPILS